MKRTAMIGLVGSCLMFMSVSRGNDRDTEDQSIRELIDTIDEMIQKEERSLDDLLKTFDAMGFESPEVKLPKRKELVLPTPEETQRKLEAKAEPDSTPTRLFSFFKSKEKKSDEEKVQAKPEVILKPAEEEKVEPEPKKKKAREFFSIFGKDKDGGKQEDLAEPQEESPAQLEAEKPAEPEPEVEKPSVPEPEVEKPSVPEPEVEKTSEPNREVEKTSELEAVEKPKKKKKKGKGFFSIFGEDRDKDPTDDEDRDLKPEKIDDLDRPVSHSEVEPETEPEVEPETEPEVEPETKPEVEPETKPEVEPGTEPETETKEKKAVELWFKPKIEVGTRIVLYELEDGKAKGGGTLLGTIEELKEESDSSPDKFFIDLMINRFLGLELAYDKVKTETRTTSGKSDGEVEMSGPVVSVVGRFPNSSILTPFASVGLAFFNSSFNEEAHWALGFESPEEFIAAGSPSTPSGGRTRSMTVKDDTGLVVMGGVMIRLSKNLSADLFFRYMDIETKATFTGQVNGIVENEKTGTFKLENVGYGGGVRYRF